MSNADKVQNLTLALEGPAAEILKDVGESSDNAYDDIWTALSRRFGHIDEARQTLKKYGHWAVKQTHKQSAISTSLRQSIS